jgi:flagellar motility protein MotE (MotC chaperone)
VGLAALTRQGCESRLDRLDEANVLTIFHHMKEKQVGEILPLMTREHAIALTQALVARQ